MKNSIWVGKNAGNDCTFSAKSKMIKNGDGFVVPLIAAEELYTSEYLADFFGLNLKNGEIVELIFDTDTGKVEVKRPRETGWYLVYRTNEPNFRCALAMKWDGRDWYTERGVKRHSDGNIAVLCKLPDNEYLRGLE